MQYCLLQYKILQLVRRTVYLVARCAKDGGGIFDDGVEGFSGWLVVGDGLY